MIFTNDNLHELEVLMLFDLSTSEEGIKIHGSANPGKIEAAKNLYQKGMLTQEDGGYLTDLGYKAAEHAQALNTMLNAHSDESASS